MTDRMPIEPQHGTPDSTRRRLPFTWAHFIIVVAAAVVILVVSALADPDGRSHVASFWRDAVSGGRQPGDSTNAGGGIGASRVDAMRTDAEDRETPGRESPAGATGSQSAVGGSVEMPERPLPPPSAPPASPTATLERTFGEAMFAPKLGSLDLISAFSDTDDQVVGVYQSSAGVAVDMVRVTVQRTSSAGHATAAFDQVLELFPGTRSALEWGGREMTRTLVSTGDSRDERISYCWIAGRFVIDVTVVLAPGAELSNAQTEALPALGALPY